MKRKYFHGLFSGTSGWYSIVAFMALATQWLTFTSFSYQNKLCHLQYMHTFDYVGQGQTFFKLCIIICFSARK